MEAIHKKRREVFFTNLLLLGFDISSLEKEHGISSYHKDMFALPNKSGFEVVTHFLFGKLNKITNNEFRIIWPLLDKKMEQEFRKTCYMHLTKIAKESVSGIQFPRMYPTMLMSPGGDRFYELYTVFSTYVLQKHIDKDKVCDRLYFPTAKTSKLRTVKETSLKLFTTLSLHEFLSTEQTSLMHQQKSEETAEDFLAYYRHTKERIVELTSQRQRELDILHELCSEKDDKTQLTDREKMENATSKKDEYLQKGSHQRRKFGGPKGPPRSAFGGLRSKYGRHKILETWKNVEAHLSKDGALWDIVKSELDSECSGKAVLDGSQYVINVPEHITTNYRKDLQEKKVQCLVENGKLSVKSFLHLMAVTLKCYEDTFKTGNLPNTETLIPVLKENTQKLEMYLDKVRTLSQKLCEIYGDVSNHIEKLEPNAYSSENFDQPAEFPPFTPTLTFTPRSCGNSSMTAENFLHLTPSTSRKSTRKESRRHPAISPLHFSVLNFPGSPGENYGHLKPSSNIYSSKKKCGTVYDGIYEQNGSISEAQFDISSSMMSCTLPNDESLSYAVNGKQEQMDCSLMKLLSPVSQEDSMCAKCPSESSNYFSEVAIDSDQQFRTPPPTHYSFDMSSVEKLAKLSQHLHSEDNVNSKKESRYFPHLSFSGEEMLDDMTLPCIPNF